MPVVQPATKTVQVRSDEVDDSERLIRRRVIGAGVISVVQPSALGTSHRGSVRKNRQTSTLRLTWSPIGRRSAKAIVEVTNATDRPATSVAAIARRVYSLDDGAHVRRPSLGAPSSDGREVPPPRSQSRIVISHRSQCPVPVPSRGGCDGARSRRPRLNRFQYIQTLSPQRQDCTGPKAGDVPNQPFRHGTRRVGHQAEPPGSSGVNFEPRQDADRRRFREVGPDKRPLSRAR